MTTLLDSLRAGRVEDLLPDNLAQQLQALGVEGVTSSQSGDVHVVRGTVVPLSDRGLPHLGALPLQAPGLNSGLRFQLALDRPGGGAATRWALDLDLDRVSLVVPGLRPAQERRHAAAPTRLEPLASRTDVRVVGRAVLRIAAAGGATPSVELIDVIDPVNPFGPRGPVVSLHFEPPSFFLGSSSFGFTVDDITYDQSTSTSPAPKPAAWKGLVIRRATLFLPPGAPLVGDVSLGVFDVFLGDPAGVEGTAFLELGGQGDTPAAVTVEQQVAGAWQTLSVAPVSAPGTRPDRFTAALQGTVPPPARVRARLAPAPPAGTTVRWVLPGGGTDPSPGLDVQPGDVLQAYVGDAAPTTVTFTGTWAAPPAIRLTLGSHAWDNVTSLAGRADDLAAATFTATGAAGWRWDGGAESGGATTGLPAGVGVGVHVLELRQSGRTLRRVRVEVRHRGPVLVGCQAGTFTTGTAGTGTAVPVLDVTGTYGLAAWHTRGQLERALPSPAGPGGSPTVDQGQLAEVVTASAVGADGTSGVSTRPPAEPATQAHVRFVYDSDELSPTDHFWAGEQTCRLAELGGWAARLGASARFVVVGRCDDLSEGVDLMATLDTYNRDLAVRRAQRTRAILVAAGVDPARIAARGEQSSFGADGPPAGAALPSEATTPAWLARATPDYRRWARRHPGDDDRRRHLRRGSIYAYDVAPTPAAVPAAQDRTTLDPAQLRALVPGADPTVVTGGTLPTPPQRQLRYRVRVAVGWQDPTARSLGEAVPSRAEVLVQWPGRQVRLPDGSSPDLTRPGDPPGSDPPVWRLCGRWSHDRTAGSDEFTLSLDVSGSPAGIAQVQSRVLAGALGLAPAVVGAAGSPTGGDAALVGALILALGGAASALLRDGKTVVTGVTIEHLHRGDAGGSRTRLTVDYTVELSVEVGGAGLPFAVSTRTGRPMKLRYRGVGVEVDTAAPNWWDGVGLVATGATPEVVDPGSWRLGPPLDDLLRVVGVRSGAQSQWLEVDLALSADLGVVKLSSATVRIVFGSTGIAGLELRGLRASVDIPATLRGEGALDVSGGVVRAGISLEIVPLKVMAVADLSLGADNFVALTVGVRFPAPIPFANSGLGLFGLVGRFVANGRRTVDSANPDPVERELAWLAQASKYGPERGQYALGLGAVIGTVPDAGFTFHALGMLTVEFPRPAVIFGIIAELLSGSAPAPVDQADRPGYGLAIIGLVVIDQDAVTIAVRGHYEIPGVLILDVPVGAWFPYVQPERSWVHLGVDGQPGRTGAPVTLTLLPGVLDVRVWAFVMVHGNGLSPGLMGEPDFEFGGFAIGFGAGWEIRWAAGPIRLEASAMVLAGFGTSPFFLAAGIWVRGELDLVILRISARGELRLRTDGNRTDLHGEFCGEIDCFFFSISGCVRIDVSATLGPPARPPSPVSGVDLVSRLGHATAKAAPAGGGEAPRVWPDTIPVVHFAHVVAPALSGGDFRIGAPMPGPVWSGSRDLKYAYRLTGVSLEPTTGAPLDPPPGTQFDTAWWWPGVRSTSAPTPLLAAAGTETRDLALLTWAPWTGLLPLSQPATSPGDPGPIVASLCEPVRRPEGLCLVGELGRPTGSGTWVLPEAPGERPGGVTPARLLGRQPHDGTYDALVAAAVSFGAAVQPAAVSPLAEPAELSSGGPQGGGWRLAGLVRGGQELGSIGFAGTYDPPLESASLLLEVCPVSRRDHRQLPLRLPSACVELGDLDPETFRRLLDPQGHLRYRGLELHAEAGGALDVVDLDRDGRWEVFVPADGLRIRWAHPVGSLAVRVVPGEGMTATAYDERGEEVARQSVGPGVDVLTIDADGMASVTVWPEGDVGVVEICAGDPLAPVRDLLDWKPGDRPFEVPEVVGVLADGRKVPWKASVRRGPRCVLVSYLGPGPGPWNGVLVGPTPGRRTTIVGSCGVRWETARQRREAEQHRVDVLSTWNRHAAGPAGTVLAQSGGSTPLPLTSILVSAPPRPLLRAGTEYRLAVTWEWQSWARTGAQSQPPVPHPGRWQAGGTDTFVFRTADLAATTAPPRPVELVAESVFDPRGAARYVTGAQPSGPLPHLLDDPIRVSFSVDYLPALLNRYGFRAHLEVRPTDVAPGAAPDGAQPPDVTSLVRLLAWRGDSVLLPTERRVSEVAARASRSCAAPSTLGGTAADVLADLEPDTAYDLVLVARPSGLGTGRVLGRWHFRTSRFRDVRQVLDVLGLPAGDPTAVAPADVLLTAAWPALPPLPNDDAAFDDALAALGLDPRPLSAEPRTTTLWAPPDPGAGRTVWALAGVLLEAPEPVARKGRIAVEGSAGSSPLAHLRSTASGTRVLLAPPPPAPPVVVAPTDALRVRLVDALRALTAEGGALLRGGPRTVRREVS